MARQMNQIGCETTIVTVFPVTKAGEQIVRTKTLVTIGLIAVLALAHALGYACLPPIDIDVIWGKGGPLSATVELVATVPRCLEVERIDFFVDGKWIGTDTTEPYIIKWDTTTVPDGKHDLYARGFTADGDVLKSNVLVVVVDNRQDSEADG